MAAHNLTAGHIPSHAALRQLGRQDDCTGADGYASALLTAIAIPGARCHILTMAGIFKCPHCGAQYDVTYQKTMFGVSDCDTADCKICGQEMATWKSSKMPIYTLKQHPITGPSNGH